MNNMRGGTGQGPSQDGIAGGQELKAPAGGTTGLAAGLPVSLVVPGPVGSPEGTAAQVPGVFIPAVVPVSNSVRQLDNQEQPRSIFKTAASAFLGPTATARRVNEGQPGSVMTSASV
jgi:hypothetical protein